MFRLTQNEIGNISRPQNGTLSQGLVLGVYHQHTQLLNKFSIAEIIRSKPVMVAIKRELKRLFPELKADESQIMALITNDVLKREVLEGEKLKEVQQRIRRSSQKLEKKNKKQSVVTEEVLEVSIRA
ncbi:MAG: hypothetical protein EXS67_01245 [Candidatus Margulisbacteria bacterium]|nr:hypothetical protein [Candidatus Margulisiibacteriota bacterium]